MIRLNMRQTKCHLFPFSFPINIFSAISVNTSLVISFLVIFALLLITWDLVAGYGSFNTGIAHFAHLGGAIAGYFMIDYWEKHSNHNRWDR